MLKRRTKLREKWFFDCSCSRCSDPTELGSHASSLLCQVHHLIEILNHPKLQDMPWPMTEGRDFTLNPDLFLVIEKISEIQENFQKSNLKKNYQNPEKCSMK